MAQPGRMYEGTYIIIQPPDSGRGYAYLEVENSESGVVITSELRGATGAFSLQEFSEYANIEDRVQQWLDMPAGSLAKALQQEDRVKMARDGSPLADFFNRLQLQCSGAQISAVSLSNGVSGLPLDVHRRDILAAYPYPNTFVVLEITGAQLRTVIERSAEYLDYNDNGQLVVSESFLLPKVEHYNYDFYAGIDINVNYSLPKGKRITALSYLGKAVDDKDILTICVNNFRATGAGGHDAYRYCKVLKYVNTEMTDLILDFFESNSDLSYTQSDI